MSVAILIEFKTPDREDLYIPVAAQGVYSTEWVPTARRLGLQWLPLFRTGTPVGVEYFSSVLDEFRQLRAAMAADPRMAVHVERLDFILEALAEIDPAEVDNVFIG